MNGRYYLVFVVALRNPNPHGTSLMRNTKAFLRSLFLIGVTFTCLHSFAQEKMPLKIVVGFPPGGSADVLARLVADAIRNDFSSVTVDNKAGAGGRIALNFVKASKPDGQTVIILPSGPMVLFPHVYKKLEYDAVKDFTPISQLAS